jgi:hypothetical protein
MNRAQETRGPTSLGQSVARAIRRVARPQTPRALPERPYRTELPRDVIH